MELNELRAILTTLNHGKFDGWSQTVPLLTGIDQAVISAVLLNTGKRKLSKSNIRMLRILYNLKQTSPSLFHVIMNVANTDITQTNGLPYFETLENIAETLKRVEKSEAVIRKAYAILGTME